MRLTSALRSVPARSHLLQQRMRGVAPALSKPRAIAGLLESRFHVRDLAGDRLRIAHAQLQAGHFRHDRPPTVAREFLRGTQPLVTEHAREKLRTLGRAHRRHHADLFLPGEVRVEELLARHPQPTHEDVGYTGDRVSDLVVRAVETELGVGQTANDAVVMAAEVEVELYANARAGARAVEADRITSSPSRRVAVDRPRNCLENRGFSGPVRPDDSRDAGTELDPGVRVLAEVLEDESVEVHL